MISRQVVPVSALKGDGVTDLLRELKKALHSLDALFPGRIR